MEEFSTTITLLLTSPFDGNNWSEVLVETIGWLNKLNYKKEVGKIMRFNCNCKIHDVKKKICLSNSLQTKLALRVFIEYSSPHDWYSEKEGFWVKLVKLVNILE